MNPEDTAAARWKPIRQAREAVEKAWAASARSQARLQELRGRVGAVEHADRQALGAALIAGKVEPASQVEKLLKEIGEEERRAEALALAITDSHAAIRKAVSANRDEWRTQTMRSLAKAKNRYEAAIDELEAAREELSDEATLIGWLDDGEIGNAASDLLGGRAGMDAGRPPMAFSKAVEELRRDAEAIAMHPVSRGDPHSEPRFELATGGGSKWFEAWRD